MPPRPGPLKGSRPARRILVDSSVWIEFYRPDGRPRLRESVAEALLSGSVVTTPLVVAEVVQGAPDEPTLVELLEDFEGMECLDAGRDAGARAGRIGFALRRRGRPVPATDLEIAAVAIGAGCELWHQDRHFSAIASVSGLSERSFT